MVDGIHKPGGKRPRWRRNLTWVDGLAPTSPELSQRDTALMLVDMQFLDAHRAYGFGKSLRETHPRIWRYYFKRIEDMVVPNTLRLLHAFRKGHWRVIHLTLGAELPDASDFGGPDISIVRPTPSGAGTTVYHKGTFEHKIIPQLAPVAGELVINKTSRSAFTSTSLERTLMNLHIRTLVVAGVATGACVDLTARDAIDRGFRAVIVEDATADLDEILHDAALRQFAFRWGNVWTCADVLKALRQGAGPRGANAVRQVRSRRADEREQRLKQRPQSRP